MELRDIAETIAEFDANRVFLEKVLYSEMSESKTTSSYSDNFGDAKIPAALSFNAMTYSNNNWLNECTTENAKLKFIQILKIEILVPKQRWSLEKMLVTLVCHRKNLRLYASYCQFRQFAYQTIMQESAHEGQWLSVLQQKDWNNILNLGNQCELERHYSQVLQTLYKIPSFGTASTDNLNRIIDKSQLNEIIDVAHIKAPLISSMVFSVGPTSHLPLSTSSSKQFVFMKLITILVILCRLAHQNNINYFPLLILLYIYSVVTQVNAIILLNYLGLSVLYPVLLRKLRDIITTSQKWIK